MTSAFILLLKCAYLINYVAADDFPHFLPLTQDIVNRFHDMTWEEKIPYLFTEEEWGDLINEFHQISSNPRLCYDDFVDHFADFADSSKISIFWKNCDADNDSYVDIKEYANCRGDFDKNGDPYYINEYEQRGVNLLSSFEPSFVYDEDGIIID